MKDKRFIEETFPVKEVSIESAKEKNIRHGHISTLHIWWARRPLASSRATNYAALVPAPKNIDEWNERRDFISDFSDGRITWIEMYTRIQIDDGVPAGAQVVMVDITGRKRAEEEKEKLKEQLNRARRLESIGTLAGGVEHDFNNVLMGIQGNAALIMLDLDPADHHYQQLMYIEEQVKSGADLTRKLLGFARGDRYALKPSNINEIIEKLSIV
ncbi:MAG TPA: DUF1156 domain-containing protein [Syntrophales bacterium]|nr:DUF1156 domain-containing protein [Syntrophales bacterium]